MRACRYTTKEITLELSSIAKEMFVFFLTSMVTYIFHCTIIVYILSSLKNQKKKIIRRKKRYRWNSAQNHYSLMQIMTTTTTRTVWRLYIVLNSEIFQQILYDIVLIYMLDTFYLPSFFLGITYTVTIFWATAECNMERWIMHMSGTSTGMNGVKLAHHMS